VAVTDRGYDEHAAGNGSRRLRLVAVSQPSAITRVGKRAIDLLVGVPLVLLALPLIFVLGVGSAVTLRAWPLFVQRRVGKGGREFPFVKLRTLPVTTPSAIDKYHLDGVRIPAFCRFLRHRHLDELPQLLLVPIGWMSLVGPRPEMPAVLARYPAEFASARSCVRPGCTGFWQVSTSVSMLICEAPEYDLAYVSRGSLRLDVWILARTLRVYLPRARYIEMRDLPRWTLGRGFLGRGLPAVDERRDAPTAHAGADVPSAITMLAEASQD
jgi:lipopolysaccharide/colanic/teichoic acid biosynthesis glycosyltransferase